MDAITLEQLPADRPVLLLDIDGVLNPITPTAPSTWDDWVAVHANGYDLWLSAAMGEALATLPATPVWCTTWNDDPEHLPAIEAQLGGLQPHWPGTWGHPRRWKQNLVYDALERFPAVAWVDDEERWSSLVRRPDHIICVHPNPLVGLTPAEVTQLGHELAPHANGRT